MVYTLKQKLMNRKKNDNIRRLRTKNRDLRQTVRELKKILRESGHTHSKFKIRSCRTSEQVSNDILKYVTDNIGKTTSTISQVTGTGYKKTELVLLELEENGFVETLLIGAKGRWKVWRSKK